MLAYLSLLGRELSGVGLVEGFGSNPRTLGEALNTAVGARDQILGPAEAQAAKRKFELELGLESPLLMKEKPR